MGLLELTISQIKLLHQLEDATRELTLKEAAELVPLSLPAASRTVDDLVRRGIVQRHEDAADRRMKRISLTQGGRAVIRQVNAARMSGLEQFTHTLGRAIYFINPPIAAIALAVTLFAARESRDETVSREVDFAGIAAITVGLTNLVLALVLGHEPGRLTDRIGPRPLMTGGLLVVAAALFIQSRLTVHTGYGLLLPGFVLMGAGMGLVMSPMSTAAMNAVDRTKAGVASGVLSMSRMVGGTFGVAIMGALVTAIGAPTREPAPAGAEPATAASETRPRPS